MACFTFYCRLPRAAVFVKWNCCVKCNRSIVIPCCLVAGYQRFEEGCTNFCFILQTRLVGSRNKYLAWILLLLLLLLLLSKGLGQFLTLKVPFSTLVSPDHAFARVITERQYWYRFFSINATCSFQLFSFNLARMFVFSLCLSCMVRDPIGLISAATITRNRGLPELSVSMLQKMADAVTDTTLQSL